jgi:hypothetical protein
MPGRWILDSCVLYEDVRHHFLERWRENLDMMRQKLPSTSSAWDRANELAELGQLPSHSVFFISIISRITDWLIAS